MSGSTPSPSFLRYAPGLSIAYMLSAGKSPGVVFMGGLMSDLTGTKASALAASCAAEGRAFLRFDYRGHGRSAGRFEDGTVGQWVADALAAFDALTSGPQVVVGSSLGGWIALIVALARRRVAGLVLVAAALDFTDDLMWAKFPPEVKAKLAVEGVVHLPSAYGERPTPITMKLIEEGRRHFLLRAPIPLAAPVRLLHGMRDPDVPWQRSLALAERLAGTDVRVTLVKDGDHRLSRDPDLALLMASVAELCQAPP
ncbi:MAG: alpha/beta hydrolase [Pseudomonadota bacterium]